MATKRKSLTIDAKLKILQAVDENGKKATGFKRKLGDIANEFGIKQCTLSAILKEREKIWTRAFSGCFSSAAKRFRLADKFAEVDNALLQWFKTCRTSTIAISDELLKTKAQSFQDSLRSCETSEGDLTISMSWIQRWKHRHGITSKLMCGESGAVSEEASHYWFASIVPSLLQRFSPADIFNADETGLFWKLTPQRTLAFVGEKCHGGKHSKERISVLVAASMTGEKLPLLVIGKSARPRAFRNQRVPLEYASNAKAWMTSAIFEEHIRRVDRQMSAANRKILLIIDNCPAHPELDSLRSITLVFLPPNTTSKTQPMDCGIIWSLKSHYRKQLMTEMLIAHDAKQPFQPDLMRALHWLKTAWHRVQVETIINCFRSAGFRDDSASLLSTSSDEIVSSDDSAGVGNLFERLRVAFSLPDTVSTELFTSIDSEIATVDTPSEAAIIASLLPPTGENIVSDYSDYDSSCDVDEQIPSHAETLQMLHKIRLYLLKHSSSADDFRNLDSLQFSVTNTAFNSKTQTTLDNLFTRN
jgi:DDE superfamily endonuclease/Tc5 transposase DNA-binding domain/CENP-B N-terminal DNA-binding domain